MRLGISSPLSHKSPEEWGQKMEALGCHSVVFPVNADASRDEIEAYVQAAAAHDLQIAEVGIWRNAVSLDETERSAAVDYSIRQLKLADEIGARCCVNVMGAAGSRWDGGYAENFTPRMWDRGVRMIQDIIDEAKPQNTYFSIETMPWMYPTGPEEYLKLVENVDRERFGVHMDIVNMIHTPKRYFFADDFMRRSFALLGDRIRSCHLKDIRLKPEYTFQLEECACGEGSLNLELYARLAHEADPEMPMIIEHLHSDEEYIRSMAYTRERLNR